MHRLLLLALLGFVTISLSVGEKKEQNAKLTGAFRDVRDAEIQRPIRRWRKAKAPVSKTNNRFPQRRPRNRNMNKPKPSQYKTNNIIPESRQESSSDPSAGASKECLAAIFKAKKLINKGANYKRQIDRMLKQKKTGGSKLGMKDDFSRLSTKLVDVGGENKSALACGGDTASGGAKDLKAAVDTLDNCGEVIAEACNTTSYQLPADMTKVDECKEVFADLAAAVKVCDELDPETAEAAEYCACYAPTDNDDYDELITKAMECKPISKENSMTTKAHFKCKKAFKACNNVRKGSPDLLYSCSQTKAELEGKADQAKENVEALTQAKNKTNELAGTKEYKGLGRFHGGFPGRSKRELLTCPDVIAANIKLLAAAESAPFSAVVKELALLIAGVASSLACTDDEKATLTTQAISLGEATENVQAVADDFAAAIADSTEGKPESESEEAEAITGNPATTAAMALRRDRMVRDVLAKMASN